MVKSAGLAALALTYATLTASAGAAVIGNTFDASYRTPDGNTIYASASQPPSFVAGAGVDAMIDVEGITQVFIDLMADGMTVRFTTTHPGPTWLAAAFNGIVLNAADALELTGITVNAAGTTMSGFDQSRVSFDTANNSIWLNWNNLSYTTDTTISLSFATAPGQVPIPASAALLGIGLVGVAAARRRQP